MAKVVLSRKRKVERKDSLLGYDLVEYYEIVERDTKTGAISYSKTAFKKTPVRTKTNVLWD